MEKYEALETIKSAWSSDALSLGEKIITVSTAFYSAGLDLSTTAAHIHATPSELDSMLSLGEFDDYLISEISEVNPPKTTWTMLASASDEELVEALKALRVGRATGDKVSRRISMDEYVYYAMVEASGPSREQLVGNLPTDALKHVLKKGSDFNALSEREAKFIKSIAGQRRYGKVLSEKQISWLTSILLAMADKGVIKRDSIDGDQDICDTILDAIGR